MTVQVIMNFFSCAKEVYKLAIIRWSIVAAEPKPGGNLVRVHQNRRQKVQRVALVLIGHSPGAGPGIGAAPPTPAWG